MKKNRESNPYDDFNIITDFENLYQAHRSCRSGKLWKDSVAHYELTALESTTYLQYLLQSGKYKISEYHCFKVNERGKERNIKSVKYKDRVVQKNLNDNIFIPFIMPKFIYENGASQRGKGTDFQLELLKKHLQEEVAKNGVGGYAVIGDFRDYFNSIIHEVINGIYEGYFTDEKLLSLIRHIHASIPGGVGVPLGNQLSQVDALLVPNKIDHFIKERLHIRGYGRYMDDFYLIHHDKQYLIYCLDTISEMARELGLELNAKKTKIVPLTAGFNFLGFHYYVTEKGKVVMRIKAKSKSRERRKIRKHALKVAEGKMTYKDAKESYQAWRAHASRGDTFYMIQEMDAYFYGHFESYLSKAERSKLNQLRHKQNIRRNKRNGKTIKQPSSRGACKGQ